MSTHSVSAALRAASRPRRPRLRRAAALVAASAVTVAVLAACGTESSSDGESGKRLAVLSYNSAIPFNAEFNRAFQAAAKQLGDTATAFDGKGDPQTQFAAVNQLLNQNYGGFMINTVEGVNAEQVQSAASAQETPYVSIYITSPWYTPWEAGDEFVSYLQPDIAESSEALIGVLADHFGTEKVDFVRIGGVAGGTSDALMKSGTEAGVKTHPTLTEVGFDNSDYTAEGGQQKTAALLSRFPDAKAVVAGTAADAEGAVAAIRALGKEPGKDIVIVTGDLAGPAAGYVRDGLVLAGTAAPASLLAFASAARIHDYNNGWRPDPAERMLWVKQPIVTQAEAQDYIDRFVDGDLDEQFDAVKLSRTQSKDDWDPQAEFYPIRDLSQLWPLTKRPAGFTEPKEFIEARDNGGFDKVEALYAEHYKTPLSGPAPAKR